MSNERSSLPSDSTTTGISDTATSFCATLGLLIVHATWRLHMEVTREIVLPAPREEVWAALTEAERLEEWFANDVELEVREGGEGVFRWDDGDERHAVVEEVDEERRLALRFDDDGLVELELEDAEDGTLLVVTESAPQFGPALELSALALCTI